MIELRKATEIQELRGADRTVAKTLDFLEREVKAGMSLKQISEVAEEFTLSSGTKLSFRDLYDFPSAICTSLNEVCIHSIVDSKVLEDDGILGLDVGTLLDGYHGDTVRTLAIGKISRKDGELIVCVENVLYFAIGSIREDMHFEELSALLEEFIASCSFAPSQGYCGYSIEAKPYCEPETLNYLEKGSNAKSGPKTKNGVVFCIESMTCQKDSIPKHHNGRRNAGSVDRLDTTHYECCVAIVKDRAEIPSQI